MSDVLPPRFTLRSLLWRSRLRSAAVSLAVLAAVAVEVARSVPGSFAPARADLISTAALGVSCTLLPWLVGGHWRERLSRSWTSPPTPVYLEPMRSRLSDEPRWLAVRVEPDAPPAGWIALRPGQGVSSLQPGLAFVHGQVRRGEALVVSRLDGNALWPASPLRGRLWALARGLRDRA